MSKADEFLAHVGAYDHDNANHHNGGIELMAWCSNNRLLTFESLRLREAVENPSPDLVERIAAAVVQRRINGVVGFQKAVKIEPSAKTLEDVRFALAALLETVR